MARSRPPNQKAWNAVTFSPTVSILSLVPLPHRAPRQTGGEKTIRRHPPPGSLSPSRKPAHRNPLTRRVEPRWVWGPGYWQCRCPSAPVLLFVAVRDVVSPFCFPFSHLHPNSPCLHPSSHPELVLLLPPPSLAPVVPCPLLPWHSATFPG